MTTITVQKLDPPRSERGPWGLQTTEGKWLKIFAKEKAAAAVEEGATFEVETKANEFNGKTSYVITKATKTAGPGHAIIPKTNYQNSKNPRDEKQIFCLALLKSGIESGQVTLTKRDLQEVWNLLSDFYNYVNTGPHRADLNDSIDY